MNVKDILKIMQEKRSYICDHLPMSDFNDGQISALSQLIKFIEEHSEVDEGYAE